MLLDDLTILVTGANGFVGSRTAVHLADHGARVRALVRRTGETPMLGRPGIEEVEGDFTIPDDARRAVEGATGVVHCAAAAGPDLEAARRVNRGGTRALLDAASDVAVDRFVHVSTMSVYDRADAEAIHEDVPLVTEGDPYSVTKAEAEREVERSVAGGMLAVILRPPAILGWAPTSTWGQRIPERIRSGEMPERGEDTSFAWVHVDDFAEAIRLALTYPSPGRLAYNVCGGQTTWGRYVRDVLAWFDDAPEPALRPGSDWSATVSSEAIARDLGWKPERDYETSMGEAERHWRDEAR